MRKAILGILLLTLVLTLSGCDWQTSYNVNEQIEFLPESGAAQYAMSQALAKSLQELKLEQYAKKKVYIDFAGGSAYSQSVLKTLALAELAQAKAVILSRPSEEEQQAGKRALPADFELKISLLTCGLHSYDGILRKHITGLALVNLEETDSHGETKIVAGKLSEYQYRKWVFSTYFIAAFLLLLVALPLLWLVRRK